MRIARWKAKEIIDEINKTALNNASSLGDDVVRDAKSLCPVGEMTKEGEFKEVNINFMTKKGKHVSFEGSRWSGRKPGALRDTIRRITRSDKNNVRVYAGGLKVGSVEVYYAHFIEKGTVHIKAYKFLRRAFEKHRARALLAIKGE